MLGAFFMTFLSVKCYGSTAVSKTASGGSTPSTDANYVGVAEWLRSGLQIHVWEFDSHRPLHFRLTDKL